MKKKLKRTIAALSAIAMLFATAAVLPEKTSRRSRNNGKR